MELSNDGIVLLSAGLDSAAAMRLALDQGDRLVLALTFDYGQKAAAAEIRQANRIASYFDVPHQVLELPWFSQMKSGGSLLNSQRLPEPSLQQLDEAEFSGQSAKQVWVPNRNGAFLEIAAGLAEDRGVRQVVVGFNAEEAETFPDNSVAYVQAINRALLFSTSNGVQVVSPTAPLRKTDIVRKMIELDFPLPLLWSCYQSAETMCGRCESCMRLKRALVANRRFEEIWFADPALH